MKVLVTGGAGFIGSHTVDLLLARGHRVRILDALMPPVHLDGQAPAYLPPEAELMRGDVRDRAAWEKALDGMEAVFHFAAYQDYLPDFAKFFHVNAVRHGAAVRAGRGAAAAAAENRGGLVAERVRRGRVPVRARRPPVPRPAPGGAAARSATGSRAARCAAG